MGYQNIMKRSLKKNSKNEFVDPGAAENFYLVFGKGRIPPPNMTIANKVILDYDTSNSDSKEDKKGIKRNYVELAQYAHTTGAFQSHEDQSRDPMWELEIFTNQMKLMRGWSADYATTVYQGLEAKPGIMTDNGGYKGAKRIAIPSNLVGEDSSVRARGVFEEKSLQHKSKDKKGMGEEEEARVRSELQTGFGFLSPPSMSDIGFHTPLKTHALTHTGTSASSSCFASMLSTAAEGVLPDKATKLGTDGQPSASAGPELPAGTGEPEKAAAADLGVARPKTARTLKDECATEVKKLRAIALACKREANMADSVLDSDIMAVMQQRLDIATHCLGVTFVDDVPADGEEQDVTLADTQYATLDPESETDHDNDRV